MNKHYAKNQRTSRYIIGASPTPERQHHLGGFRRKFIKADDAFGAVVQRYRARWASPLDLYRDKQIIDRTQFLAGLQFGRIYRYAVSGELACQERARRIDSPSTPDRSDSLQRALALVEQAHAALTADTINVVIDVCAYARPVSSPEALSKLKGGLGSLALEWGMTATEMCQCRKG